MPSIRSENTRAHSISGCRLVRRPRTIAKDCRRRQPMLPIQVRGELDADELRCLDVIKRFHRGRDRDAIRALKYVVCPVVDAEGRPRIGEDGRPMMRRYIREVARFLRPDGYQWNMVTWGIDEIMAQFQPCPSGKAAMAAFRQPPEPVQARS